MNEKVKVGLDEWIVADRTKTDLMTDGLSGCVAVGLAKGDKVSLSHVYSNCTADNWDAYKGKLDAALTASGMGDLHGSKAVLVCSQGDITDGSSAYLPQKLKAWLEEKGAEVSIRKDNGCTMSAADGPLTCTLKKDVDPDLYRYGFKTSTDESEGMLLRSKLSGDAKAAGLPHPSQADRDYAGPMLTNGEHPANGLYRSILAKIPDEAEDFGDKAGMAAALTVRALRKGIDGVDEVSLGAGGNSDRLFLLKGSADAGRSAFIEMGQVEDTPLRSSSREAGDLHRAMAPVVVAQPSVPVVAQSDAPVVAETHSPRSM
ncbi:MAG: XVIPCD domain-containing protein [Lysobacteraceae bacterium]